MAENRYIYKGMAVAYEGLSITYWYSVKHVYR